MKTFFSISLAVLLLGSGPSGASAAVMGLFDWGFNIDGSLTVTGDPLPPSVDASGFDFVTGLGTVSVTVTGAGAHDVLAFFDHEIDEVVNTYFNETGATSGTPAGGQSWEIDEPGWMNGDIFVNFSGGTLDAGIGTSVYGDTMFPDDVSMAMGWDFGLGAGEIGLVSFVLAPTPPGSGFYLIHTDPDSGASIYLSSTLETRGGEVPIPEPGTIALVGTGLLGLWGLGRRRGGRRPRVELTVWLAFALGVGMAALPAVSAAAPPVVKTVPWVAANPLIPHDTWSGRQIRLKGTSDVQGSNIQYVWDFGDGSPVAIGTVTDRYVIEATHTYTGSVGTIFSARLTVQDTSTGETGSRAYYVAIRDQALPVEVNVAIDEGLWYLHKSQYRWTSGGVDYGDWTGGGYAASGWYGVTVSNITAFEVNGHLESGDPGNPYAETVQRGLRRLFTWLTTDGALAATQTNGLGTFNPDSNGNGYGVYVNQSNPFYQGGMFMDAIIASGTPGAVATTGQAPSGANPGVLGRTYADIAQDMADAYAYCQYDGSAGGGWRYNCQEWPDNSSCQWAAIGLIPAERVWGLHVPQIVKDWNVHWLDYSQNSTTGWFGYTNQNPIWGPYATTPSGMVQMAMDGIGRGASGSPSWDKAETFLANNFCNTGGYGSAIKNYYYGLFSFVKSMLLHDSDANGIAEPIVVLQSTTNPANDIDWYAAEASRGDRCDGVARTLVGDQSSGGWWWGHNAEGRQYPFETAFAIIMLNRTIFEAGAPVAVAQAVPNPGVVGQAITLDGSGSYHQDPSKSIVLWEWDLDDDGVLDVTGPVTTGSFGFLGDHLVRLRVTDDGSPPRTAETVVTVRITTPPIAPTADAGGPYVLCPQSQPWFLDGTGSVNPDEGDHELGCPGDTITSFLWELNGDGGFDDAVGPTPDATAFFTALGTGDYLIQLEVTDTTSSSFPSSGFPDLSDTDSAQVFVRTASDPACACVDDLRARAKSGKVQLVWTDTGADHYTVYRSMIAGGPYGFLAATASRYSTYLDSAVTNGVTYYYVVREAALNGDELCQSNEASATPQSRVRR